MWCRQFETCIKYLSTLNRLQNLLSYIYVMFELNSYVSEVHNSNKRSPPDLNWVSSNDTCTQACDFAYLCSQTELADEGRRRMDQERYLVINSFDSYLIGIPPTKHILIKVRSLIRRRPKPQPQIPLHRPCYFCTCAKSSLITHGIPIGRQVSKRNCADADSLLEKILKWRTIIDFVGWGPQCP